MKLTIERNDLLRGLGHIQAIVERRGTLPILSNVLMRVADDVLTLSATDLEVGVVSTHAASVSESGSVTLGAKKLHELVRELGDDQVLISTDDGARVRIESGPTVVNLLSISPEEYPTLPSADGIDFVPFDSVLLAEMIDRTLYASSTDETRYNLNGVFLEVSDDKLVFVATNGHRLAKVERTPREPISFLSKGITVPRKGMSELRKICDTTDDSLQLGLGDGFLLARTEGLLLSCRLIDGDFPDYRQVIPGAGSIRIVVERERLIHAVRRLAIVAHERSGGFQVSLAEGALKLSAQNPDLGEAHEEIPVDYQGDPFKTGFNARYTLDTLASLISKEVVLELIDELSAVKIRPADDPDHLAIIMPMRA
jgi:DNA polymerase-3 subunit beta